MNPAPKIKIPWRLHPICQHLRVVAIAVVALSSRPSSAHPGDGIVVDAEGRTFFVHGGGNRIMKSDASGELTKLAELTNPHRLVMDTDGDLYAVSDREGQVWKISPDGQKKLIYPLPDSKPINFIGWGGDPFTLDADGNIYCLSDRRNKHSQILKIGADGRIANFAGGDWGYADGKGSQAQFRSLHYAGFGWTAEGALLVTDHGSSVRKITPDGTVTTLAGSKERGFADGAGKEARFKNAVGLAVDAGGNILVADSGNRRIRKIAPDGTVSTLAGSGEGGHKDGSAETATFDGPVGIAVGPDNSIYVLDYKYDHPRVRRISPEGKVTTFATVK
jgi:sugar lactone lactonase YvrE